MQKSLNFSHNSNAYQDYQPCIDRAIEVQAELKLDQVEA
jgi:hypothetical protein